MNKFVNSFIALLLTACIVLAQNDRSVSISVERKIHDIDVVLVRAGTFMRKSAKAGDETEYQVILTKNYYIGKYEITNEKFAEFLNVCGVDKKGRTYSEDKMKKNNILIVGHNSGIMHNGSTWEPKSGYEKHPAVNVTWFGANEFCKFVGGRLPTEAEWEFAARGGLNSKGYVYSGSDNIDDVSWYRKNSNRRAHPVGTKEPNELGIHDMSGNVWEWCNDWYSRQLYTGVNPIGSQRGSHHVIRGGSFRSNAKREFTCRSYRERFYYENHLGFRVVFNAGN